jgi:hypothetical protein
MGLHTAEHFESRVEYSVDRDGHLKATVLGSDEHPAPEALSVVERACRH